MFENGIESAECLISTQQGTDHQNRRDTDLDVGIDARLRASPCMEGAELFQRWLTSLALFDRFDESDLFLLVQDVRKRADGIVRIGDKLAVHPVIGVGCRSTGRNGVGRGRGDPEAPGGEAGAIMGGYRELTRAAAKARLISSRVNFDSRRILLEAGDNPVVL